MSFFKKDKNDTKNYADADVQTQLARIIEQLGFLERKIDSLSQNNRGPRPGGRPGFGRPGGFSGGHREGGFRGNREGGFRGNREGGHREGGFRGNRDGGHRGPRHGGQRHGGPRQHSENHSHSSGPAKDDNFGNV